MELVRLYRELGCTEIAVNSTNPEDGTRTKSFRVRLLCGVLAGASGLQLLIHAAWHWFTVGWLASAAHEAHRVVLMPTFASPASPPFLPTTPVAAADIADAWVCRRQTAGRLLPSPQAGRPQAISACRGNRHRQTAHTQPSQVPLAGACMYHCTTTPPLKVAMWLSARPPTFCKTSTDCSQY
jgi:hypothetical protein